MGLITTTVSVFLSICLYSFSDGSVQGDYFDQKSPGLEAEVFAPGLISLDNRYEYGCHFSRDGKQFGFTVTNDRWDWFQIYYTSQDANGIWSVPKIPRFCQGYQNLYPFFSADGQTLFFSSPRPSQPPWPVDLYTAHWNGSTWGQALRIPEPASTPRLDYHPTVTGDGTIYYNAGGFHRSRLVDGVYTTPERLPYPINDGNPSGTPWIAPDESYLIFESGRPGGYGQNDLYISYRDADDRWSRPLNLGPQINTNAIEDSGFVTDDGKVFFFCRRAAFTTSEQTDIYWIDARAVLPDPNGSIHNLTSGEVFGSLQCAIRYAHKGDILEIDPGLYRESFSLDKDLVIQSSDPNNPFYIGGTIIQGNGQQPVVTLTGNSSACEIIGLTLRGGSVGISGSATDTTLRHCRMMDNVLHGVELADGSKPHLHHCLITANGQTGMTMHAGQGGRRSLACEPLIESCYIIDNGRAAIAGGRPVIVDSLVSEE